MLCLFPFLFCQTQYHHRPAPPPHVPFPLFIDSLPHTPFVILDDVLPGHLERRSDPVGTLAKGGNSEKRCMASRPGSW